LPEASAAVPMTIRPKMLTVSVDQQGRYFVGSRQLTEMQLFDYLRQAEANNPGRQVVEIRADQGCPWKYVVNVINACLRAEIRNYRTVTAPAGS
jgi:biopolymer transport protein ExbD